MKYNLILIFIFFCLNGFSQGDVKISQKTIIKSPAEKISDFTGRVPERDISLLSKKRIKPINAERKFTTNYSNEFQGYPSRDSILTVLKNLKFELKQTQLHLHKAHKNLKWGLITSVIGYSIVVTGGVLGGTEDYAEWGQPLIFTGGIIGLGGGVFVINGVNHLGKAGLPCKGKILFGNSH